MAPNEPSVRRPRAVYVEKKRRDMAPIKSRDAGGEGGGGWGIPDFGGLAGAAGGAAAWGADQAWGAVDGASGGVVSGAAKDAWGNAVKVYQDSVAQQVSTVLEAARATGVLKLAVNEQFKRVRTSAPAGTETPPAHAPCSTRVHVSVREPAICHASLRASHPRPPSPRQIAERPDALVFKLGSHGSIEAHVAYKGGGRASDGDVIEDIKVSRWRPTRAKQRQA